MAAETASQADAVNTFYHIFASALVFFMQAGFAMLCAGSVRAKNVKNIMLKNLLDACGGAIGFWALGWALAYGGQDATKKTFVGDTDFFLSDDAGNHHSWFFQFAFAATAATIVAGTVAERCSMIAYICYSMMLTGFVYPVVAHAIWSESGFLSAFVNDPLFGVGVVDFAGSGVVHLTGGVSALWAAYILGPRLGRFTDAVTGNPLLVPAEMPGHSTSLQMLGTFILWTGWYGFNPGSTLGITGGSASIASLSAVTTTIAAASGCISCLTVRFAMSPSYERTYDLTAAMNGALGGLVAITAGCSVVQPWAAFIIGLVAGPVYLCASNLLLWLQIDDTVDAVPVHMANGIWALIATGLFADPDLKAAAYGGNRIAGLFYGDGELLGAEFITILFVFGWVTCTMLPFFFLLNRAKLFRVSRIDEEVGLDISKHGGAAYVMAGPDENALEDFKNAKIEQKDSKQADVIVQHNNKL
jgi:Amt family ammonium transporter